MGLSWNRSMVTPWRLSPGGGAGGEHAAEPLVAVQRLERAGVAHQLLDRVVVDEPVTAEDLDGVDGGARDDVAGEHPGAARGVAGGGGAGVDRPGGVERHQARGGGAG